LLLANGQGDCLFINNGFRRLVGSDEGQASHLSNIEHYFSNIDSPASLPPNLIHELNCSDNTQTSVKLSIQQISGELYLFQIAESLNSENQLQSQKLETLGMLAGGIAHDFNNVLAGILGHITYLKAVLPQTGKHVESLEAIEEGSNKASLLTREIVNFSKMDDRESDYSEICEVIEKTCSLLRGALPPRFQIVKNLPISPYVVGISEGRLAQIIVNLVMNARDAIKGQGVIEISVECIDKDSDLPIFSNTDKRAYCLLKIKDNGSGIPKDLIGRVCKPYFSTKKDKGTGLGLATVTDIVKRARGYFHIDSEEGLGTTISVFLPLCGRILDGDFDQDAEVVDDKAFLKGSGYVLVVDDEEAVRNVIVMSLKHIGYEVDSAENGIIGLDKFKLNPKKYDLVILDMLMPELSGEETFYVLKEINPDVKVLFISGFTSELSVHNVLKNGGSGFLQKPFTIEQLARKVLECL
jgi:two-component system cell cycle sensor histidine kinase/response regulator CckA